MLRFCSLLILAMLSVAVAEINNFPVWWDDLLDYVPGPVQIRVNKKAQTDELLRF